MLYLAIPAHNEVATIGVLLWRLRTVLAEFPREYEVVVYDDASSDETADVAEQYAHTMPVTVLRGVNTVGYAGAVDALARYVSAHTRYPRRDAMLLLQGDFTDPPGIVPEFARRFEGGADVVVGERTAVVDAPSPVRRLFTAAGWALRPFVRIEGVRDLTGSMRLARISVLRDLLRTVGDDPICEGDSWTANADLLLRLVPHARRVESVPMEPTYGVRMRDTRRVMVRDALATLRWGWRARGRRAVPTTAPEQTAESSVRQSRSNTPPPKRREEPELTVDRLRERTRDRGRSDSSLEDVPSTARRDARRPRDPVKDIRETRPEMPRENARDVSREIPRDIVRPSRPRAAEALTAEEIEAAMVDPFAGPASNRRARLAKMPSAKVEEKVENQVQEKIPAAIEVVGPLAVPVIEPPLLQHTTVEDVGRVEESTNLDSASSDAAETVDTADDAALRERKRRRNRRSRRRKSKTRGKSELGDDTGSPETDGDDSREAIGSDDDDAGKVFDAVEGASDTVNDAGPDAEASSRRRGRRGRRGGSRRSRGRGTDAPAGEISSSENAADDVSD